MSAKQDAKWKERVEEIIVMVEQRKEEGGKFLNVEALISPMNVVKELRSMGFDVAHRQGSNELTVRWAK